MITVMCLTTVNRKLIILLTFKNETLDLVIFTLDTRNGNVVMICHLFMN